MVVTQSVSPLLWVLYWKRQTDYCLNKGWRVLSQLTKGRSPLHFYLQYQNPSQKIPVLAGPEAVKEGRPRTTLTSDACWDFHRAYEEGGDILQHKPWLPHAIRTLRL